MGNLFWPECAPWDGRSALVVMRKEKEREDELCYERTERLFFRPMRWNVTCSQKSKGHDRSVGAAAETLEATDIFLPLALLLLSLF